MEQTTGRSLTRGPVTKTMLRFAVPMILGDLLQQCYNIADTLIVGRFLGANALAAVGSSFTLMTFLNSILLGLAMGSGTVFSIRFGQKDLPSLREGILASFALLGIVTLALNAAVFLGADAIIAALRTPAELVGLTRAYLLIVFSGMIAVFLYNFFASVLRSCAKMDHLSTGGTLLNQKFTPSVVAGEAGLRQMANLIRAYFNMDGHHIQFNVIDRQTLLDAQAHPEEYKDLIVRVAGYSDHFRNLSRALQDEIIARTEQSFA